MSQVVLRDGSRFPMDRQSVLDIYSKVQKLEFNHHDAFIHLARKCSKGVKGKFPELDEVLKEYGFFIPGKEEIAIQTLLIARQCISLRNNEVDPKTTTTQYPLYSCCVIL